MRTIILFLMSALGFTISSHADLVKIGDQLGVVSPVSGEMKVVTWNGVGSPVYVDDIKVLSANSFKQGTYLYVVNPETAEARGIKMNSENVSTAIFLNP